MEKRYQEIFDVKNFKGIRVFSIEEKVCEFLAEHGYC